MFACYCVRRSRDGRRSNQPYLGQLPQITDDCSQMVLHSSFAVFDAHVQNQHLQTQWRFRNLHQS